MGNYTQHEALTEIFSEKKLNAKTRVSKSRYANGDLSQKSIDKILIENGFKISREQLYVKQQDGKKGQISPS